MPDIVFYTNRYIAVHGDTCFGAADLVSSMLWKLISSLYQIYTLEMYEWEVLHCVKMCYLTVLFFLDDIRTVAKEMST